MQHVEELRRQGAEACLGRLWTHTVGIANNIRDVGYDPITNRRGDGETMGSGCAGFWGSHHFILTAGHVPHGKAQARDVRIYWRPTGALDRRTTEQVSREDVTDALPIRDPNTVLHRCAWEDLALITIDPKEGQPHTEFFDIANDWIDPQEGDFVHCCGFPLDRGFIVDRQMTQHVEERSIGLSPFVFDGPVLPLPTEDELKFKITEFDSEKHYLISFEDAARGFRPDGYSGGAAWRECDGNKLLVWKPTFKFAGICSRSYEKGTKEQIIKASTVRRFLEEVFGPVENPKQHF
jgi:hypothetical protein